MAPKDIVLFGALHHLCDVMSLAFHAVAQTLKDLFFYLFSCLLFCMCVCVCELYVHGTHDGACVQWQEEGGKVSCDQHMLL